MALEKAMSILIRQESFLWIFQRVDMVFSRDDSLEKALLIISVLFFAAPRRKTWSHLFLRSFQVLMNKEQRIQKEQSSSLKTWKQLLHISEYERKYLHIAMPAALEGLFMILLSNVDLIMVGTLGTMSIAAVSIFTQPRMIILTLARSLGAVLALLAAEHFGRGQRDIASTLLKQSLFFWGLLLGIIHLAFYRYLDDLLLCMGAREEYLDLALSYADIALAAVFATSLTAILQAVMLGFGQTAEVLKTNLQGNIINILANALLIFGLGPFPALGVQGAAIGTLLGTLYTLTGTLLFLHRERMFQGKWIPSRAYFKEFLPVFGGVFGEQGFERIGMVLYTRMTAELGTIPYAVHAVCMNVCDFYYCFAGGLGKASMVLAGQSIGKNDKAAWQQYLQAGVKWSFIFSTMSFLLTFCLREEIFTIYSRDSEALALGIFILAFVALVSYPEAHAMICAGVLRGSGKTTQVAVYSFFSITILRPIITACFLYTLEWGLMGAWLALAIDQSIRAVCSHFLLHKYDMQAMVS